MRVRSHFANISIVQLRKLGWENRRLARGPVRKGGAGSRTHSVYYPPQIHLLHRASPVVQTLCTKCGPGSSTHMTGFDSLDCPVFPAPQYSTVRFLPLPHQDPVAKASAWDLCPDELSHQWWRRWRREGEIYHPAPHRTSDAVCHILQGSTSLPHDLPLLK